MKNGPRFWGTPIPRASPLAGRGSREPVVLFEEFSHTASNESLTALNKRLTYTSSVKLIELYAAALYSTYRPLTISAKLDRVN